MITYVTADLFESGESNIAHGCNTAGVMGAGVAGIIANRWPAVRQAYENRCLSMTFVLGTAQPVVVDPTLMIWNLGTQQAPGPHGSLWGVLLSFGNLMEQMVEWQIDRVAIPRIGCGIANLKWSPVASQIEAAQKFVGRKAPEVVVYTHPSEAHKSW